MQRQRRTSPVKRWWILAVLCLTGLPVSQAQQEAQLQSWWAQLGSGDEDVAFSALLKLERCDAWAGVFLAEKLEPASAPSRRQVRALAENLSSRKFRMRQEAHERLWAFGSAIRQALQDELARARTAEARKRLARLLDESRDLSPRCLEQWRTLRAIRVLERRGDDTSRRALTVLAGGAKGARKTQWARGALHRLDGSENEADWAGWGANPQRTHCFATRGIHRPAHLAWQVDMGDFRYPATSMVVRDGIAYLAVDHGDEGPHLCSYVYAIDLEDKKTLWRHGDLRTMVRSAPVVADDQLYFVSLHDSVLVCLDVQTGRERWRYRFSAGLASEPLPAGPTVLVCGDDNTVHAIDTQFGKKVWSFDCQAPLNWSPAVSGQAVLIPAGGLVYSLDLGTGQVRWKHQSRYQAGPPAIAGDRVFLSVSRDWKQRGRLLCLDLRSGKPNWQLELASPVPFAPSISGEFLYALAGDEKQVLAVNCTNGQVSWKLPLGTSISHTPAIADGMLYAVGSNDGTLLGVDLARRSVAWRLELGARQLPGPPAVQDGVLYFSSRRRTLCAVTEIPHPLDHPGPGEASVAATIETILLED
jgi:outer membrane protein assembly factor BamB